MSKFCLLALLLLNNLTGFAITSNNHLRFTDDVAYSKPSFYFLIFTSLILLGGIMLFQSSLVALAKTGRFLDISRKARKILRNGFISVSALIGVLFLVLYSANNELLNLLYLNQYAFQALTIIVFLELSLLAYTFILIRVSTQK